MTCSSRELGQLSPPPRPIMKGVVAGNEWIGLDAGDDDDDDDENNPRRRRQWVTIPAQGNNKFHAVYPGTGNNSSKISSAPVQRQTPKGKRRNIFSTLSKHIAKPVWHVAARLFLFRLYPLTQSSSVPPLKRINIDFHRQNKYRTLANTPQSRSKRLADGNFFFSTFHAVAATACKLESSPSCFDSIYPFFFLLWQIQMFIQLYSL